MNFRTQIPLQKQPYNLIDYNSKLLLLGSCFSVNIGNKLGYFKFQSTQNPFGILFQPKAIERLILNSINKKIYTEEDIFNHNDVWSCFDAHSEVSSSNKNTLLDNLNTNLIITNERLHNASHIIITLGTAWVYRFIETDTLVANCHKVPQKKFLKELLSVDEISESLQAIVSLIKSINTKALVLFTVSPVRHIKDGYIENQRSKAHLLSAIHQVVESIKNTYYFPSYEIMMDELRDYRFYAEDMVHPSEVAINFIWEKFSEVWISEGAKETMKEVDTIQKGLAHRPFNPNTEQHHQFLNKLQQKKETLQKAFPFISF